MSSAISYECECGNVMVVSVERVSQCCDEFRTCDVCGDEVPWDEFTVGDDD